MSFRDELRDVVREVLLEVLPQFFQGASGRAPGGELHPIAVGVPEAARLMGVGVDTVRSWIADGSLPAKQKGPGSPYLIRLVDLQALVAPQAVGPGSGPPPSAGAASAEADRVLRKLEGKHPR